MKRTPWIPCSLCGKPVHTYARGSAEMIRGYRPYRGGAGGANAVHVLEELGVWAHWDCVIRPPVTRNQVTMFPR